MAEDERFKDILTRHNLRKTEARKEILRLLFKEGVAVSHADLETALINKTDRVTIYRTLSAFEEKGVIHRVIDGSGVYKYALCHTDCDEKGHYDEHVHFNCTQCGNTYCIENATIPEVRIPGNFKPRNFHLFAEGICDTCANN